MIASLPARLSHRLTRHRTDVLPGEMPLPPALQMLSWIYEPIKTMEAGRRLHGDVFSMRFPQKGMGPYVLFSHPEAIKEIFTGDYNVLQAGKSNAVLEPILGANSLLLMDGERHMRERRLLLPPFHGERMQAYAQTMRECTDTQMKQWKTGTTFPMHPELQSITLDVISRAVLGLNDGPFMLQLRPLLVALLETGSNPLNLLPWAQINIADVTPWGRLERGMRQVDALLFEEFERRRKNSGGGQDILSMLIEARDENGDGLSNKALRDEMMTLLVAGHETTATSMSWALHWLTREPQVLRNVHAELDTAQDTSTLTPASLPYLDGVIKETLRLSPVIPMVGRVLAKPLRIAGHDLPAGATATPCIYLAHRHPSEWPDPERFDPARFIGKKPSPYSFFPFGGGVRRCIGMAFAMFEMKVVLAQILRRFTVGPAPGYTARLVRRGITFAPSESLPIVLRTR